MKNKGKTLKNIGIIIIIATCVAVTAFTIFLFNIPSGFGPEYDTVLIKQNIGGKLLCKSVYTADIHNWEFSVSYDYINPDNDTIDFMYGIYKGIEWEKDEQILKAGDYLILPTYRGKTNRCLIVKNLRNDSLNIIEYDSSIIESMIYNKHLSKIKFTRKIISFVNQNDSLMIEVNYKYLDENESRIYKDNKFYIYVDPINGIIKN